MIDSKTKDLAVEILQHDAEKIKQLLSNQEHYLCIAQCKAFEEVVDTQMFGLSREIDYAVRMGVLSQKEGHQILSNLEKDLNSIYNSVYADQKEKQV